MSEKWDMFDSTLDALSILGCEIYSYRPDLCEDLPIYAKAAMAEGPVDIVYRIVVRPKGWRDELFRDRLPFTFGHKLANGVLIRAEVEREVPKEQLSKVIDMLGGIAPIDAERPEWAFPSEAISMMVAILIGLQEWRQENPGQGERDESAV